MNRTKNTSTARKESGLMHWFSRLRAHQVTDADGADATWVYFDGSPDSDQEQVHFNLRARAKDYVIQ